MIRPARRFKPHHYLLMALGWPILAAAAALLYLRWQDVDRVYMIAAVALTPFLGFALAPAAVIAWFSKSRILRIFAAAVVGFYLFTVSPFDAVIGCGPDRSPDAVTVMTANVLADGSDPAPLASQVRSFNPDILFLQEANSDFLSRFETSPELEPWGYRSHREPDASRGVVVWSKWPLADIEFASLGLYQSVTTTVALSDQQVDLIAVHVASPTDPDEILEWRSELSSLAALPAGGPTLMAGDFNATEDHAPFRNLLAQGWTDVHDNKGCGLDQTWPTSTLPFPVMRLDHILVSEDIKVLSADVVSIPNSDHLAVVAKIELAQ